MKKRAKVDTVFCRSCCVGIVLSKPYPPTCPLCHGLPSWSSENPTPRVSYTLTADDRRFLRAFRIQADD